MLIGTRPQSLRVLAPQSLEDVNPAAGQLYQKARSLRDIHRPMRRRDPRLTAAAGGVEHLIDAPPVVLVQTVVELIQEQPVRILHQRPRQQRQTLFSVRQRQERSE